MQTTTNAKMISRAIRESVKQKLGNETLASKEVEILIGEIGEIVVNIQKLYFSEIHKLERKLTDMIGELSEHIDTQIDESAKATTVNLSVNVPPAQKETSPTELFDAFFKQLDMLSGAKK